MELPESFGHQGKYRLLTVLGRGGFGAVYKARYESLDGYVAIKILRTDVVQGTDGQRRFQREMRSAARLGRHPNVISIYEYGEYDGRAYLVLEYVEGPTLRERLLQPVQPAEFIQIVSQIASGLDFAHARHLIHRDVKPSNIILGRDGRAVLSDLGMGAV